MRLSKSLYARMALILLIGLAVSQGVSFWLQTQERTDVVQQARGQTFSEQVASVVQLLEATTAAQRQQHVAAMARSGLRAEFVANEAIYPNPPRGSMPTVLAQRLGGSREVRTRGNGPVGGGASVGAPRSVDVQLADGQWVRLTEQATKDADTPALSLALLVQLGLTLLLVAGVTLLAVRQATQPLSELARAADRLGQDLDAAPLPETGSSEMRQAAAAFNTMQTRIRALVAERERALAAVSHDLRTPLTRMRLRCELIDDDSLRAQLGGDIDAMSTLIDSTLAYLRGHQTQEVVRPLDLNALLASLIDDAAVQGRNVTLQGIANDFYPGRLSGLRRALQNLIDNAFKYGAHNVTLTVQDDPQWLRLGVQDDGPGIAPDELHRVTEPYYRCDAARSQADGSVGLGLTIVRDVARLHGGTLALANLPNGGLRATLSLPRRSV